MHITRKQKQTRWTIATVVFVMLAFIVGIIAQSNERTKQKNELVSEIYSSQLSGVDQQKLARMIIQNSERIDYVATHKPIINFQLRSTPADAALPITDSLTSQEDWCTVLQEIVLNTNEVAVAYGVPAEDLRSGAENMIILSNCKLSE